METALPEPFKAKGKKKELVQKGGISRLNLEES